MKRTNKIAKKWVKKSRTQYSKQTRHWIQQQRYTIRAITWLFFLSIFILSFLLRIALFHFFFRSTNPFFLFRVTSGYKTIWSFHSEFQSVSVHLRRNWLFFWSVFIERSTRIEWKDFVRSNFLPYSWFQNQS